MSLAVQKPVIPQISRFLQGELFTWCVVHFDTNFFVFNDFASTNKFFSLLKCFNEIAELIWPKKNSTFSLSLISYYELCGNFLLNSKKKQLIYFTFIPYFFTSYDTISSTLCYLKVIFCWFMTKLLNV